MKGYLTFPYTSYSTYQKVQIEKARLRFLQNCRFRKRPPPSLRVSGASSLDLNDKINSFSSIESDLLNTAIINKGKVVKRLAWEVKNGNLSQSPLSPKDTKAIRDHFSKKQQFYEKQDVTKWKEWPEKSVPKQTPTDKKRTNFKKRQARNRRKLEKTAKRLIQDGSVVVLVNEEIPDAAIAVLGKGLGFIPTPSLDIEGTRLDMRLTANRILNHTKCTSHMNTEEYNSKGYSKLRKKIYGPKSPALEQAVNEIINTMSNDLDSRLRRKTALGPKKSNLSAAELKGLQWLEKQTRDEKISIVEADKGGAILIVYPSLLKKKTLEKLENPSLYEKLPEDPTQKLHKELFNLWVKGKEDGFVSPRQAKEIMGVSDNPKSDGTGPTNRPSTLPHFKPGISYFYPSLKIHKLEKELLKPGIEPPVRLITALQDGISKRSDVFIAEHFLRDLEKDF